jgi:Fe-S-cluster-containing dehydrogenase component
MGEEKPEEKKRSKEVTRREFLKDAGLVVGGAAVGSMAILSACTTEKTITQTQTKTTTNTTTATVTSPAVTTTATVTAPATTVTVEKQVLVNYQPAASQGYLVVDSMKCCGCLSCMSACSLVNEGKESFALSRIQVTQSSFDAFPKVTKINVCRQCVYPPCVDACIVGALTVDAQGIRRIDETKCNGCKLCIDACPHNPRRIIWKPETNRAAKCDLCVNAKFWGQKGGTDGKQACVEVCSMDAIKLVKAIPKQEGNIGYDVNLRSGKYPLYKGN